MNVHAKLKSVHHHNTSMDEMHKVFITLLNDLEGVRHALTTLHEFTVRAIETGDDLRPVAPGLLNLFVVQDNALESIETAMRKNIWPDSLEGVIKD